MIILIIITTLVSVAADTLGLAAGTGVPAWEQDIWEADGMRT
jgi:hypothetical protein